jgi:hypothetical protein
MCKESKPSLEENNAEKTDDLEPGSVAWLIAKGLLAEGTIKADQRTNYFVKS